MDSNAPYPHANFLQRLAAYMIDGLILYPINILIVEMFGPLNLTSIIIGFAIGAAYHTWFVQSDWCATPGKRILGLIILRPDGSKLDTRGALERHIGMMLPFIPMYSGTLGIELGLILSFWLALVWFGLIWVTEEKTAMHDILCKTRVFEGRAI